MANSKILIDYEQAKRATYEEIFWKESEQAVVRHFLAKLPKIDAVEVIHGRWNRVEVELDGTSKTHRFSCSECGFLKNTLTGNYCPNCGTKMDG